MARFNYPQSNFLSGEVSPRMYTHVDDKEYFQMCKEVLNSLIYAQGGGGRRPGTQFIANEILQRGVTNAYEDIDEEKAFIPFVTSDASYILVIGTGTVRTSAFPLDVYDTLPIQAIRIQELTTVTDPISAATINSKLPSQAVYWFTNFGGGSIFANASVYPGYASADLKSIQYAQSGDTMILTHPNHPPVIIQRGATDTFFAYSFSSKITLKLDNGAYVPDAETTPNEHWPFLLNTDAAHTMDIDTATVGTARTLVSSKAFFKSTHVGAVFKITSAGTTGFVEVTGYTSATQVTVTVHEAIGDAAATANWCESYWSTCRGWPRSVTFFKQRAVYGGNATYQNAMWGSELGDFQWLDNTSSAGAGALGDGGDGVTDSYVHILSGTEQASIQWLSPDKKLMIGTNGREWLGTPPLNPTAFDYEPSTAHGSSFIQPVRFSNSVQFVQGDGQRLREFTFNFQEDNFKADDISEKAEHMVRKSSALYASFSSPKIIKIVHQRSTGITWCLDNNGGLFGVTRNKENGKNQISWHFHKLGGSLSSETPKVLTIACVPNRDQTADELYLLVKRTVNAGTKYYIERLSKEFQHPTVDNTSTSIDDKPIYMDSAKLVRLGSPGLTFSGFDYLEGQTVECIVDGTYEGTKVVSGGNIVFTGDNRTELIAGLSFTAILTPLPFEAGSVIGTALGAVKRVDKLVFEFLRTISAKFGRSTAAGHLEEIDFRSEYEKLNDVDLDIDEPTPLYSGQIERDLRGDALRNATVSIVSEDPLPMQITGFSARGVTSD